MTDLIQRYGRGLSWLSIGLTAFWLLALVILPYLGLFEQSFRPYLPVDEIGGPNDHYTLHNYMALFSNPQDITLCLPGKDTIPGSPIYLPDLVVNWPIHLYIFILTIVYSSVVTLIVLMLCYPIAYCMAKVMDPRSLPTFFLLLVIPLWVSELMRSFSWYIILSLNGPLSTLLMDLGILSAPVRWTWGLCGYSGIMVGLIYTYVLFMLFPVYNAMTSLDSNQIEAAEDLGAGWIRKHWRVIIPHCKPGIASGSVTVFMLAASSLLVPSLLASPKSRWFTEVIQQWMFESHDWNSGAAYAFLLLVVCTIFVTVMMKLFKVGLSDIAK